MKPINYQFKCGALLFLASVAAACGGRSSSHLQALPAAENPASVTGRPEVADSDIDKYIDAALPPNEKAIMHTVMLHLRKTGRFNVLYFSGDGHNYSNRIALRDAMRRAVEIAPGRYQEQATGKIVTGPPDDPFGYPGARKPLWQPPSDSGAGTGAFRRVVSPPGYAWIDADVTIPCGDQYYANGSESGYEMLGAWGATNHQSVDAGLEHYPAGTYGANENLAVFIRYQNGTQYNGSYYLYTDPVSLRDYYQTGYLAHITCDQTATEIFYVYPSAQLNIEVDGDVEASGNPYESVTAVYNVTSSVDSDPNGDWPYTGGNSTNGIVEKRFTGLGQPSPAPTMDNSFEGVANNNPVYEWNNTHLATEADYQAQDWTESAFPGTRYDTYPCYGVVLYQPISGYDKSFAEYDGVIMNNSC